jgi:flagellar basal body P-ring protein FlgI
VNVSSLGNAKSLRGGTLIATPLKGADGQIYALAQGNLIVGGAGRLGRRLQGADQPPQRRPRAPARRWSAACPRR